MSYSEVALRSLSKVFLSDSYDPVSKKFNGKKITAEDRLFNGDTIVAYEQDGWVILTSILALPNKIQLTGEQSRLTLKNFLQNLIGYEEGAPDWKNVINGIFAIVRFLFWPLAFARNLVKIFTEAVPVLFADFFNEAARQFDLKARHYSKSHFLHLYFKTVSKGIRAISLFLIKPIHFVGRAITSPIKGAEHAWHETLGFFGKETPDEGVVYKVLRYGSAFIMAGFSTFLSIAFIAAFLGASSFFMSSSIAAQVGTALANVNIPYYTSFLTFLSPVFGITSPVAPALETLASIIALIGVPLATLVSAFVVDSLRALWNTPPVVILPDFPDTTNNLMGSMRKSQLDEILQNVPLPTQDLDYRHSSDDEDPNYLPVDEDGEDLIMGGGVLHVTSNSMFQPEKTIHLPEEEKRSTLGFNNT